MELQHLLSHLNEQQLGVIYECLALNASEMLSDEDANGYLECANEVRKAIKGYQRGSSFFKYFEQHQIRYTEIAKQIG